jgi:hypothetical protein
MPGLLLGLLVVALLVHAAAAAALSVTLLIATLLLALVLLLVTAGLIVLVLLICHLWFSDCVGTIAAVGVATPVPVRRGVAAAFAPVRRHNIEIVAQGLGRRRGLALAFSS